jgi:hypothetical protein
MQHFTNYHRVHFWLLHHNTYTCNFVTGTRRIYSTTVEANEFFYSESLAAGSLDQLPAPLERIPADA